MALGCGKESREEEIQKELEYEARTVLYEKRPTILRVNISAGGTGLEVRFHDFDGDKKTVEQYSVCYESSGGGIGLAGIKKILIRDTTSPSLFGDENQKVSIMTLEEQAQIDRQYASLVEFISHEHK